MKAQYAKTNSENSLRGIFPALNTYIMRSGNFNINNLMVHFRALEKQDQVKPQISSWK